MPAIERARRSPSSLSEATRISARKWALIRVKAGLYETRAPARSRQPFVEHRVGAFCGAASTQPLPPSSPPTKEVQISARKADVFEFRIECREVPRGVRARTA